MPTYNIGPCGCCGGGCPVSWRFTTFNLDFQFFQLGSSWQTSIYVRTPYPVIEVTYGDGTTESVQLDLNAFTFDGGTVNYRRTSTFGTVAFTHSGLTCTADWEVSANIPESEYDYMVTAANGTFTYGNF